MVQLTDKSIEEFQAIFKKEYGKELTKAEAAESAYNLVNLFDVLLKADAKERAKRARLRKEPKGFHVMDGTYNCKICYAHVTGIASWYDKFGVKCLTCQRATESGIIPPEVFKDRKCWLSTWDIQREYGIHPATARKMVRTGELKAKIVETEERKPYFYIFLKKDNPNLEKIKNNKRGEKSGRWCSLP